jgi:2-polyprenyl-6-hydroxyphenyl methylase/3-demethylubiquinone-9 3-methyltransferase
MRKRFAEDDPRWTLEQGNVLDEPYLASLGVFDVVYSWGVLHHTGAMWRAMELVTRLVAPGGVLYVALYNDQGSRSRVWRVVKRTYNMLPRLLRFVVVIPALILLWGGLAIRDLVRRRPFATWRHYRSTRGMSPWHDLIDWVGGYPFEVARPSDVLASFRRFGFSPQSTRLTGGLGCNEFVLARAPLSSRE